MGPPASRGAHSRSDGAADALMLGINNALSMTMTPTIAFQTNSRRHLNLVLVQELRRMLAISIACSNPVELVNKQRSWHLPDCNIINEALRSGHRWTCLFLVHSPF
jgi:hypothetical protein